MICTKNKKKIDSTDWFIESNMLNETKRKVSTFNHNHQLYFCSEKKLYLIKVCQLSFAYLNYHQQSQIGPVIHWVISVRRSFLSLSLYRQVTRYFVFIFINFSRYFSLFICLFYFCIVILPRTSSFKEYIFYYWTKESLLLYYILSSTTWNTILNF